MAPSPKRDRLLWLAAAAAALALLFVQTWTRAHRSGGIDLTTYLEAARAVQRGENPYRLPLPFPYIYPPFMAFALTPLAYVPADIALALWFAASVAAIVWSTREMLTLAYPALRARPLTPFLVVLFALLYTVLQSNLRNGQVNPIVVALAVAALRAHRSGAVWRGALWWAAAVAIKIVPAVLAPFYVRRRLWRVCLTAAAAAVVLCLLPALWLGAQVVSLDRDYVASFLAGSFGANAAAATLDFSLGGMVASIAGVDGWWVRAAAAVVPIAAVFAADCRAPQGRRTDALAFALYLAVVPLASPKSEVHHLAFAIPGAALASAAVRFGLEPRRGAPAVLIGAALAGYLAAIVSGTWSGPLFFAALTALAGALLLLLGSTPNPAGQTLG